MAVTANWVSLIYAFGPVSWLLTTILLLGEFLYFNLRPIEKSGAPTKRIWYLKSGCELLRLFLITATVTVFVQMVWLWCQISMITPENSLAAGTAVAGAAFGVLWAVLLEAIVFWNGMIRVYLTSVQLGLKHRVLAALCGWIPILNIWYLRKIIRITADEAEFETEKWELDTARAESEICKTKYPILLVHGVFFRDFRYVNYWGRIPKELQRNGATVYYGQQQSAAAVEDSGRELADRIRQILAETGCEKVNIIAHSKGGLDSRAAIAHAGCAPCVASLTTINTPHRGCVFVQHLLDTLPAGMVRWIAARYNALFRRLGDEAPDFLGGVQDLASGACQAFNQKVTDDPGVFYQSVMTTMKSPRSAGFPLNITWFLVNRYDRQPNDGLVALSSAQWGEFLGNVTVPGRRGVSHGDVIDLMREDIPGFAVRDFYIQLVHGLQERGF